VEVVARRRWQDDQPRIWTSLLGRSARGGLRLAWRDFTVMQLSSGSPSIDFAVPAELSLEGGQEVLFGFRFLHLGNSDLTITSVDLQRVADAAALDWQPNEWHLLGRLVKGRIGLREADSVSVRQTEPAGLLLYGGRPRLRLSEGRYRLTFSCHAGAPRIASQPVLAVEIVARKRRLGGSLHDSRILLRRTFTAEAVQEEPASVDFDVSEELSDGADQDFAFEFRFFHLGNADLTIAAVNLRETQRLADAEHSFGATTPRAPALITGKTNIIIIGNCQAQTVYEALVRTRAFNTRVDAKYHFVGLQQNLHELARNELANCEILLVQDINDWEHYPLRADIREDLRIMKFPLLHFASLWPFDHYNGPGDREAYEREAPNLTFLYLDGLLARLRREIPDRDQRLVAYRSLSIEGVVNYVRLHDFEKRRLTAMDKQFGIDIGQFILDNFQRKRLFYTTNHPNGQLLAMLLRHLLRYLGIDATYRPINSLDHLSRLQVPVHPKVAKALDVKWASEATKYLYGGERITWETYVRRYIEHYG
jgi:Polysaccharide biosynthesis enzyme WcbI